MGTGVIYGSFLRVFEQYSTVSVTAQETYGDHYFERWAGPSGNDLEDPPVTWPQRSLNVEDDRTICPVFRAFYKGDFDRDKDVDAKDLNTFILHYETVRADLDANGIIDDMDIKKLAESFGSVP